MFIASIYVPVDETLCNPVLIVYIKRTLRRLSLLKAAVLSVSKWFKQA